MKMRPQFNLRFRDAAQFELVMDEAGREGLSMNEWILQRMEDASVVLKGQRLVAEREIENGKKAAIQETEESGAENSPVGAQS